MTAAVMSSPVLVFAVADRSPSAWVDSLADRLDRSWLPGEWDWETWTFAGNPDSPQTWVFRCLIPGCGGFIGHRGSMCVRCRTNYSEQGRPADFAETFRPAPANNEFPMATHFCLAGLPTPLRVEMVFALQAYTRDRLLSPERVRQLLYFLPPELVSLLDLDESVIGKKSPALALFRSMRTALLRARVAFDGVDLTAGDVWDCELLGLSARPGESHTAASGCLLDFRPVQQAWLRELAKEHLRATRPNVRYAKMLLTATTIASRGLATRPAADHPDRLGYPDMVSVLEGFQTFTNLDGSPASPTRRAQLYVKFKAMVSFCRRSGLMEDVPSSFTFPEKCNLQLVHRRDGDEDMTGKALPPAIIAQLDAHLQLLGAGSSFAPPGWTTEDQRWMYRTIYQVLRDTGRRPSEVVTLKRDCVTTDQGKPTLTFDNHKARRLGRRLPITDATAQLIVAWRTRLATLTTDDEHTDSWLFPSPGSRGKLMRGRHIHTYTFSEKLRDWTGSIPALTYDGVDANGMAVPFPLDAITPYSFRHSYAQRHADAGTPVDVLRQLMDHTQIDTTMGYYKVSMSRRREAVAAVSDLMVDRHGRRLPAPTQIDYEVGAVAVPYGNCAEPSNVKAGGGHCPIRFQCAGCSFYRPDPSYLPAIETHLAELRVNREQALATDAAAWVVGNLQHQLDSFATVHQSLLQLVNDLPEDRRHDVEQAGRELRKARQLDHTSTDHTRTDDRTDDVRTDDDAPDT